MTSTAHRPIPWTHRPTTSASDRIHNIYDATGRLIAAGIEVEVAALIVHACNAHDDMLAALIRAKKVLYSSDSWAQRGETDKIICAAIAKAGG